MSSQERVRVKRKSLVPLMAVALLALGSTSHGSHFFETVKAIAHDPERISYARQRIAALLTNPDFRKVLETLDYFAPDDVDLVKFGGLDWNYLGLGQRWPKLQFNMPTDLDSWDVDKVRSASLRMGRNFVIIKLGDSKDLGLPWPRERLARIESVGGGVYVFCDDSSREAIERVSPDTRSLDETSPSHTVR
jgi:hypothetical protein